MSPFCIWPTTGSGVLPNPWHAGFARCLLVCVVGAFASPTNSVYSQTNDGLERLRIDQLQQSDSLLQSEISSARVDRQVEVTRLEGRIAKLEESQRQRTGDTSSSQFASILNLIGSAQKDHQELLVRDYALALEIETLAARAVVLEKTQEVKSLERLASKGMASSIQLDLQVMHKRRAELQLSRLQKQLAGLQHTFPRLFPADGATTTATTAK